MGNTALATLNQHCSYTVPASFLMLSFELPVQNIQTILPGTRNIPLRKEQHDHDTFGGINVIWLPLYVSYGIWTEKMRYHQ